MTWELKERIIKTLSNEQGSTIFAPGARQTFVLVYPNTYYVGMSNLGFQIIYQQINSRSDTACERLFMPDAKTKEEYIRTNTPLFTMETQRPLYEFGLIGFDVTFEMDYFNVIEVLIMGKVEVFSADRTDEDPIIIMGGPCATFNPEPLAAYIDVCVIGEGEEIIHELLDVYQQGRHSGMSRREILFKLAQIEGLYVPCFYQPIYNENGTIQEIAYNEGVPASVGRRWVKELDAYPAQSVILSNDTEFKNMFLVEIARGCGRHCRFCMAGYCYRKPRNRSLKKIKQAVSLAKQFQGRVGLMGAAISDYPEIDDLCTYITNSDIKMSVASLRADSLTTALVEALHHSGHKTITLAPEAGSARMRRIINKGIDDGHLYASVDMAIKAGIPNIRLYIMIGLPFEQEEDITAISEMAVNIKRHMEQLGSKGKLTLSINPFIPKPFTPFQWLPMTDIKKVEARFKLIQGALRPQKGIELLVESFKEAYIQAILARGDRRLSKVLFDAVQNGGGKTFRRMMKKNDLDENFYLYRERSVEEIMPWQTLHMGFEITYLAQELLNAKSEKFTQRCVEGCKRCGVCR